MSRDQCVNVTVSHTENLDPTGKLAKKTVRFAAKPRPQPPAARLPPQSQTLRLAGKVVFQWARPPLGESVLTLLTFPEPAALH